MHFEDLGAKTLRKVRIAAIFARNVAFGAISGPVRGGVGALEFIYPKIRGKSTQSRANSMANLGKIYGKFYGKIYPNPTTHLGGQIPKILENHEKLNRLLKSA